MILAKARFSWDYNRGVNCPGTRLKRVRCYILCDLFAARLYRPSDLSSERFFSVSWADYIHKAMVDFFPRNNGVRRYFGPLKKDCPALHCTLTPRLLGRFGWRGR
jgi:hypothetical protein